MGDTCQRIAFPEVERDAAAAAADALRDNLVVRGIIARPVSDCVLGGHGHAPGPNRFDAVSNGDLEARRLLDSVSANGVEIVGGPRTVFYASSGLDRVRCPSCHTESEAQDEFMEYVGAWSDGEDQQVVCPACAAPSALPEWRTDPPWAFGYLGLTFWNWPLLSNAFIESLESVVRSSAVVIRDKL
jgi:hypothetical protein